MKPDRSMLTTTIYKKKGYLGDLGSTVGLGDEDVASLGAEGDGDGLCEDLNTLEELSATLDSKVDLLVGRVKTSVCEAGRDGEGGGSLAGDGGLCLESTGEGEHCCGRCVSSLSV